MVIGAGVRPEWLSQPIAVSRIGTAAGFVDWSWDGHDVAVTIHGVAIPVH